MPQIRPLIASDWGAVSQIYAEGIATRLATFETQVPTWEKWDSGHLSEGRYVAVDGDAILGWVALSPVSSRYVYRGVMEESIYIAQSARGQGIGSLLLTHIVSASEDLGIWTLQGGIFAKNTASIALHEKCGFRRVGYRERIGQLEGVWYDTVLMERRSQKVGL